MTTVRLRGTVDCGEQVTSCHQSCCTTALNFLLEFLALRYTLRPSHNPTRIGQVGLNQAIVELLTLLLLLILLLLLFLLLLLLLLLLFLLLLLLILLLFLLLILLILLLLLLFPLLFFFFSSSSFFFFFFSSSFYKDLCLFRDSHKGFSNSTTENSF